MKTDLERLQTRRERDLRRENIQLRRENKELRKMLRMSENLSTDREVADEFEVVETTGRQRNDIEYCPVCKQVEVHPFRIADRVLYKCEHCGSKGRITA